MTHPPFQEPEYRYHPGVNARPQRGPVHDIAAAAASGKSLNDDAVQRAWRYGFFLIDRHFFWEAHEVLEPVWMVALPNSQARHLVQGVIQLANACLKFEMGRSRAAERLAAMACSHLSDALVGGQTSVLDVSVAGCLVQVELVEQTILEARALTGVLQLERQFNA